MLTTTLPDQWRLTGSNRRHSACKADALPAELNLHGILKKKGNTVSNAQVYHVCNVAEAPTAMTMTRTGFEPVIPP